MTVFGMIFRGNNNMVVVIQGNTRMKTSGTTRHSVENFIFDLHKAITWILFRYILKCNDILNFNVGMLRVV